MYIYAYMYVCVGPHMFDRSTKKRESALYLEDISHNGSSRLWGDLEPWLGRRIPGRGYHHGFEPV